MKPQKIKNILVLASNQPGNIGDFMLNLGVCDYLSKTSLSIYIDTESFNFEEKKWFTDYFPHINQLKNNPFKKLSTLLGALILKKYDVLFFYPGMSFSSNNRKKKIKRLQLIICFCLLKLWKIKIIIPNTSRNLENISLFDIHTDRILSCIVDLYGIRNISIQQILFLNYNIKCKYVPDVFLLNKNFINFHSKNEKIKPSKKYVVLCFRPDIPEIVSIENKEIYTARLLCQVTKLIKYYMNTHEIQLILHSLKDYEFMNRIYTCLSDRTNIIYAPRILSPHSLAYIYANADVVLSNRLHSIFFGITAGVPSFGMTTQEHDKIINSLKTLDLDKLLLDINLDFSVLVDKINNICYDDNVSAKINTKVRSSINNIIKVFNDALNI